MKLKISWLTSLSILMLIAPLISNATTTTGDADLAIGKTASTNSVTVGDQFSFQLTVTNRGPDTATNVIVLDILPPGCAYVFSSGAGTYYPGYGLWILSAGPAGAVSSLTITVQATVAGTFTNTAFILGSNITDTNTANDLASAVVAVASSQPTADLQITKTASTNSVKVGQQVVFKLDLENLGPDYLTNDIVVTDCLPPGFQYITDNTVGGSGINGVYSPGTCWWTLPGGLGTNFIVHLQITALAAVAGIFTNVAIITVPTGVTDPNTNNNTGYAIVAVAQDQADLSITKSITNAVVYSGNNIIYTLVISNAGPTDLTNVIVPDFPDTGLKVYGAFLGTNANFYFESNTFVIFSLAAGSSAQVELWVNVTGTGLLTNRAIVPVPPAVVDPNTNNNVAFAVINALPAADVAVYKTQNTNFVRIGQPIVFNVQVKNWGPNTASNIVVRDVIPAGLTLIASNVPPATTFNSATGLWNIPVLTNSGTRDLQLTLTSTNGGTFTNTAIIQSSQPFDPTTYDWTNSAFAIWLPTVYADLAISVAPSTNVLRVGNTFSIDFTVTNRGPANASNVLVYAPVPPGTVFLGSGGNLKWIFDPSSGIWTRTDTLFVGADSTFTLQLRATNTGIIPITAQITNSQPIDPITTNNFASTNVTVFPVFTLSGSVVTCATNGPPLVGVTVTLTTTNQPAQSVLTITNGTFVFTNLIPSTYTVTVATNIYLFTPSNQVVTLLSNTNLPPFVGVANFISGTVRQGTNGSPVPGVTIKLSGTASLTRLTDTNGIYIFTNLAAGAYIVAPQTNGLPGIRFTPGSVTNVLGNPTNCPALANFVTTNIIIVLRALEVVQVVQDWSNSVPLVANKATLIRAHLQLFGTNTAPILVEGARLFAQKAGGASADWAPDNGRITVTSNNCASPVLRSNINATLNFTVRNGWTSGQDTFRFSWTNGVVFNAEPADVSGDPASNGQVRVSFNPMPALGVRFIRVAYTNAGATNIVSPAQVTEQQNRLISIYPITALQNLPSGYYFWSRANGAPTADARLAQQINTVRLTSTDTNGTATNRIWYGLLPSSAVVSGYALSIPGNSAVGNVSASALNYQRHLAAHEIGHALGRNHAASTVLPNPCGAGLISGHCGECATNTAPNFPMVTVNGELSPTLGPLNGDDQIIWGYDHLLQQVISPYFYFDVMSYCYAGTRSAPAIAGNWPWNSKYTYTNIFNAIINRFGAGGAPAPAGVPEPGMAGPDGQSNFLLVRGTLDLASNAISFLPFYPIQNAFEVTPGPYTLRVLDTNGQSLLDVPFALDLPQAEFDEEPTNISFDIPVPIIPGAAGVEIFSSGAPVGELLADAYPPVIQMLQPNGGEVFGNTNITVSWTASDPDNSPLFYLVQFSSDGGMSWDTLTIDLDETNLDIPPDTLPATTNGLIRVIASDGFNTYTAQSASAFTINSHVPSIIILQPGSGSLFYGDQTIVFEASASDLDDGPLDGTNVLWTSSLDGKLGNGDTLPLETTSLSEGVHLVTATAIANSGLTNSASVQITVLRQAPPELTIQLAGNQVQLSWPASYTNYLLEKTTLLTPSVWTTVTNVPVVVDDQQMVTLDISSTTRFFRLRMMP